MGSDAGTGNLSASKSRSPLIEDDRHSRQYFTPRGTAQIRVADGMLNRVSSWDRVVAATEQLEGRMATLSKFSVCAPRRFVTYIKLWEFVSVTPSPPIELNSVPSGDSLRKYPSPILALTSDLAGANNFPPASTRVTRPRA